MECLSSLAVWPVIRHFVMVSPSISRSRPFARLPLADRLPGRRCCANPRRPAGVVAFGCVQSRGRLMNGIRQPIRQSSCHRALGHRQHDWNDPLVLRFPMVGTRPWASSDFTESGPHGVTQRWRGIGRSQAEPLPIRSARSWPCPRPPLGLRTSRRWPRQHRPATPISFAACQREYRVTRS